MKCKFCQAEFDQDYAFCPACGKSQAEEVTPEQEVPTAEETPVVEETPIQEPAEEKAAPEIKEGAKATPGKIAMAVVAGVVILAVLVALLISGLGSKNNVVDAETAPAATDAVTAETEETVPATIPADGNPDDVTCKGTYSVTDDEILAAHDTIVATVGDQTLTNGQLQAYYWAEVMSIYQQYGDYAIYFGLDFSQPLDTQICSLTEEGLTWQQYFLQCALDNWHCYQSMKLDSEEAGFEPEADYVEYIENLSQTLEETAVSSGAADAAELILGVAGAGCTVEDYLDYLRLYNDGYIYYAELIEQIVPTDEEIKAYFAENEATYSENGITKESGKYVDVRHVLIVPEDENATTGDDGYPVYSDDAWAACEAEAQKLYDQWLAGDMSEDSFAALANEHSYDSDGTDGGLYTDVSEGYMVENFNDWCFDAARQPGDHGLVKTQYGYHIMYFVGSRDIWYATAESDLIDSRASALLPASMEKHPVEIDYTAIALGLVDLGY